MTDSILPDYLKNIAYEVVQKKEKVSLKTRCSCGCCGFDFLVHHNFWCFGKTNSE